MSEAPRHYNSVVVGNISCNEYKTNPVECISCILIDKCEAGQMCVESLEKQTKPGSEAPVLEKTTDAARERFEQAMESGDPVQWYMTHTGVSTRKVALMTLGRAKKRFPDVWEKYNKISPNGPSASNITPLPLRVVTPGKTSNKAAHLNKIAAERTQKAKEELLQALVSKDPVEWYLQHGSNATRSSIQTMIYGKKKRWPEIVEEAEKIKKSRKPVTPEQARAISDDEITLSRLLNKSKELQARKEELLAQIQALNEELSQIEASEKNIHAVIDMF